MNNIKAKKYLNKVIMWFLSRLWQPKFHPKNNKIQLVRNNRLPDIQYESNQSAIQ